MCSNQFRMTLTPDTESHPCWCCLSTPVQRCCVTKDWQTKPIWSLNAFEGQSKESRRSLAASTSMTTMVHKYCWWLDQTSSQRRGLPTPDKSAVLEFAHAVQRQFFRPGSCETFWWEWQAIVSSVQGRECCVACCSPRPAFVDTSKWLGSWDACRRDVEVESTYITSINEFKM